MDERVATEGHPYNCTSKPKNSHFRQQIAGFASILMRIKMVGCSQKGELMSEDFTQKLPKSGNDEILTAIKDLDTHVTKIDNRLQNLEKKVDERLHDTRPIWHRVVADIAQLQAGQERLEKGQVAMSADLVRVSRDQIVINDSIRKMHLDFHTIDDRLRRLELNRNQPNSQT